MSDPHTPPPSVPPPHFASGYFRDVSAAEARRLVGHVPIVAGLLVGLGVMEIALAFVAALFSLVALNLPPEARTNNQMLFAMYAGVAVMLGGCGTIRVGAGLSNFRFKSRRLGIAALGIGLLPVFSGFCAPTSIAIAVYGLIVYLNDSVIAAFEMGNAGRSSSEIQAAFPP
jgi:hypothetical protein